MTVCGQRSDDPGFFTSCNPCHCARLLREELAAEAKTAKAPARSVVSGTPSAAVLLVRPVDPSAPTVEEVRQGFDVMRFLAGFVARPG